MFRKNLCKKWGVFIISSILLCSLAVNLIPQTVLAQNNGNGTETIVKNRDSEHLTDTVVNTTNDKITSLIPGILSGGVDGIVPNSDDSDQNIFWLIDYWDTPDGGNLPPRMSGDFFAQPNTIEGFLALDDVLEYIPLNVAYGTSETNCVWFQFSIQFDAGNQHFVEWYIWNNTIEPTVVYNGTPIGISYVPGDEYYYYLQPSGVNTVTFYIKDLTSGQNWMKDFTTPSTNMLGSETGPVSDFAPASAVEGHVTGTPDLTNIPCFQTTVGDGITTHRYGTLGTIPPFVGTFSQLASSSSFYWEMLSTNATETPPTVIPNSVTNITFTGAILNGNLTDLGTASSVNVSFDWGLTSSYGNNTAGSSSPMSATGAFNANLTGLAPGTVYHYRACADSATGGTDFGIDQTFTTAPVPPSVTSNNATGITTSWATLNGNLTDLGTASSVNVSFDWGLTTSYGNNTAGTPSPLTTTGAFSANLTGLPLGTIYHFRAKADGGTSGVTYGSDQVFETAAIPPSVTSNAATGITSTGAILNGNLTSLGTASSVLVAFDWGLTTSYGNLVIGVPSLMTTSGLFSYTLSGLTPGTIYHFRAKAEGGTSGEGLGNDQTFTTSTGTTPPSVTSNAATSITSSGATLNGNLTGLGTASSVNVSFDWGLTTSYGSNIAGIPSPLTTTGTFISSLTGLASGTVYHYRAKADGGTAGISYGSDQQFTTTAGTTPPSVTSNAATGITSSGATLNGNLTSLGTATSVNVSFDWGLTTSYGSTIAGTPSPRTTTGTFTGSLTGLTPGTVYHYRAKADGGTAGISYGSDQQFTTTTGTTPPSVTSNAATGITSSGATLNGNLTSLGTATSVNVSFDWGLTTSYGSNTTGTPSPRTTTGTFTGSLTGLTSGTVYHYRAKADGGTAGISYGSDQQFTTSSGGTPVVITKSVATGTDDGFSGSGTFDNSDSWYEVGQSYNAWFRFTGITIPQGAIIDSAYLILVEDQWNSGTSLTIYADNSQNPTAPTSQSNHASKTRTSAGVGWTAGSSDYQWHDSPDFTSVIQALVNAYAYNNGVIQILVDNNNSSSGTEAIGSTYENTGYAPQLYISYHTGSGTPPSVTSSAATGITSSGATLNGNLTSLGTATSVNVSFDWGLTTSYGSNTTGTPSPRTTTGTFTGSLTGLTSGTVYHYRAKADGGTAGISYGSDQQFTTSSGGTPVVITKSVATGTDDGFSGSGTFDNSDSWYEVGQSYNAWFRFTGITIPQGAIIDSAYLILVEDQWNSGTSLTIYADNSQNPTAPTSQANHASKTRTSAGVGWTAGSSDYQWHDSPDFASVIQTLVNTYTYNNGVIQILVDNNNSSSGAEAIGSTYENTGYAPQLYIRYHMP
jgi:hypothetical protein